jgi:dienelactone hydrolase
MRRTLFLCVSAAVVAAGWLLPAWTPSGFPEPGAEAADGADSAGIARRKAELDRLRRILPPSKAWEEWLASSGELPPDFDSLPRQPWLADPWPAGEGAAADWPARRKQILDQFHRWVIGTVPPPPGNVVAETLSESSEDGASLRSIRLKFGPEHKATLDVEVLIPKGAGPGPFPVFITQHNHRAWAAVAVSRGYMACVYKGADSADDTAAWMAVWPDRDWTKLTRRAWAVGRVIDWLETQPALADAKRIGLTGHSRNGKTSLIAAALDERIGSVVLSSSGAGGACAWRLYSEAESGEGIELITRAFPDWFHPRLRFFCGREDRLPVDQHHLIAAVAPRWVLVSTALNDPVESTWAVERTADAARPAFTRQGAADRLRIAWRPGSHETRAAEIHTYVDWFDKSFGRPTSAEFPDLRHHLTVEQARKRPDAAPVAADASRDPGRGWDDLLRTADGKAIADAAGWKAKREDILRRVRESFGREPPAVAGKPGDYGSEPAYRAAMMGRGTPPKTVTKTAVNFGEYIAGDLYLPAPAGEAKPGAKTGEAPAKPGDAPAKRPGIVWLHPRNPAGGYHPSYRRGPPPHVAMAEAGFAVLAFDAIGNGHRIAEEAAFHARHPEWSLMGKTVRDARDAVAALRSRPEVDPARVFVLGFGTGGQAALYTAALDETVAGAVSIAGFTPMRTDSPRLGAIPRVSLWDPLQPRLAAFADAPGRVPFDWHEVIAAVAPRPVLIVAPTGDCRAEPADVAAAVASAGKAFALAGAPDRLALDTPDDYARLSPEMLSRTLERLNALDRGK